MDFQTSMPWIAAILICIISTLVNIYLNNKNQKINSSNLNKQLEANKDITQQQLANSKEITLSQIASSKEIIRLEFNKTVLSGNRQVWINNLRDLISDYLSTCTIYSIKVDQYKRSKSADFQESEFVELQNILRIETKIVLMLNSNEEDSKKLVKNLKQFTSALFDYKKIAQSSDVFKDQILETSKTIFKKEWERVKKGE